MKTDPEKSFGSKNWKKNEFPLFILKKNFNKQFSFLDEKCFCEVLLIILLHDHVRS